jgi:hypothetical protein
MLVDQSRTIGQVACYAADAERVPAVWIKNALREDPKVANFRGFNLWQTELVPIT